MEVTETLRQIEFNLLRGRDEELSIALIEEYATFQRKQQRRTCLEAADQCQGDKTEVLIAIINTPLTESD